MFHQIERGFAPGHCLGQWISALARGYAMTGSEQMQQKMNKLLAGYSALPLEKYYKDLRYPAYTYDKFRLRLHRRLQMGGLQRRTDKLNAMTDRSSPTAEKRSTTTRCAGVRTSMNHIAGTKVIRSRKISSLPSTAAPANDIKSWASGI